VYDPAVVLSAVAIVNSFSSLYSAGIVTAVERLVPHAVYGSVPRTYVIKGLQSPPAGWLAVIVADWNVHHRFG